MKPELRPRIAIVLLSAALTALSAFAAEQPATEALPPAWLARWKELPAEDRPLQIVHGIDPRRAMPEGIDQMLQRPDAERVAPDGMRYYPDRGLGGLVCNVSFQDYMQSEEHWKTLLAGVEACRNLGLVVWLYDEDGYPSGAAGGLVLAEDPALEATELAFDPGRDDPFIIRPSYEFTHASNNYYAARRYTNLIDARATAVFIEKTHEAYRRRLEPYFGNTIRALFTDEPSLVAINIGQIPADARERVRVVDPLDPAVEVLPRVPWCDDLLEQYHERYGEDLAPHRRSLFTGDAPEDRTARRQFWELVAELLAERYYGAIQDWCADSGVASSGHTLHEESILHQVALEGNSLKVLGRMDIPGMDMLSSDPEAVIHGGWLTAALPSSAALFAGRRRVMTEVSDFSQKMGGRGPVGLDEMRATAAWQAAWGVTEFTLYYGLVDRPAETYRAYCDFVARLNAVLKPARFDRRVLVYYPIYDLWEEYVPVAEPLSLQSQSPRARQIVGSFMRLGRALQAGQIPFALVDHEHLASATVDPGGKLAVGGHAFEALLLPEGARLPTEAARVVDQFRQRGGHVIADSPTEPWNAAAIHDRLDPPHRIAPASERIVLGRFQRDGREILLVLNAGKEAYRGKLTADPAHAWLLMDPATGAIESPAAEPSGAILLELEPHRTVLLVEGR